jgi:probable F420-dependent oxidoreductase
MAFKVYATTSQRLEPGRIAAHAIRAESLGYDGLNIPEAVHDGFVGATLALASTTRIRVATSVALAFPRSPMTTAIAAWDLATLSGSRFELGLGSQIKANIEGRYATPWTAPVPRMREYVAALRAIFRAFQSGEPLKFSGDQYRFQRLQPFFRPEPLADFALPIHLGGVATRMTELAGEVADGLVTHPTNTAPRYLREVMRPRLESGASRVGRDLKSFRLIVGCRVATGRTEADVARERENARQSLAFLYSTPAYWPSLEIFGWESRGPALRELTREQQWSRMSELVDDDMLDAFVPSATYDNIVDVLNDWYGGLAKTITFPMPENDREDDEFRQVVAALQSGSQHNA